MGSPWVKNHRSELRIVHQGFQEMTHCDIHDQSLDGAQFRKFKRLMQCLRIRKQKIPWDYSNHCYFNIFNFKPKTKISLPFFSKLPSSTSSKISQAEKTCLKRHGSQGDDSTPGLRTILFVMPTHTIADQVPHRAASLTITNYIWLRGFGGKLLCTVFWGGSLKKVEASFQRSNMFETYQNIQIVFSQ